MSVTMEQAKCIVDYFNSMLKASKKKAKVATLYVTAKNDYTGDSHITVAFTSQVRTKLKVDLTDKAFAGIKGLEYKYQDNQFVSFKIDEECTAGWNGASVTYYHYEKGYHPILMVDKSSSNWTRYSISSVESVPSVMQNLGK